MKKMVKKALKRAKELEKHPLPSRKEIEKVHDRTQQAINKLSKMLVSGKPAKSKSSSKKKSSSTRKKKSL